MSDISRHFVIIVGLASALLSMPALAQFAKEPGGLWPGPMHSATPATLKGARVIDSRQLADIVSNEHPVMLDVANKPKEPPVRSKDMLWDPIHRSIPGTTWLPGAGSGTLDPKFADAFAKRVEAATGGDKDKPIVTFCHPQRWGSWNTAKRLTELGYRNVYWYPGGSEGWADQAKLKVVREDPQWKKSGFDKDSAGELPPDPKAAEKVR